MGDGSATDTTIPERIGRFEVKSRIGSGSMGVVYLGTDPLIGRRVALKTLSGEVPPEAVERLRRLLINEAKSAGGLSHPGIVTIYDLVEEDGGAVSIAMEYVQGTDLREILGRPEPIPFRFVVDAVCQVADVLDYAHLQGVVHRDVKPANLIVTPDLRVKVTDFGIAQLKSSDVSSELRSLGTPNYLAPERMLGGEVDHRADIYSLGVVLYELLTRHLPFQATSIAELAQRIAETGITPPETYAPNLPSGVKAVLEGALEKAPERRYWSAGEMAAELKRILGAQQKMSDTVPADVESVAAAEPPTGGAKKAKRVVLAGGLPGWLGGGLAARARRAFEDRRVSVSVGAIVLALTVGTLGLVGMLPARGDGLPDLSAEEQRERRYQSLLQEGRGLLTHGRPDAADEVLARAERLAAEPAVVRRLRQQAQIQIAAQAAAELESFIRGLLEGGFAALEAGELDAAESAARDALELDPESAVARSLEQAVADRHAEARARRRARRVATPPPPEPEVAEPEPPAPVVVEPIVPEPQVPLPEHADLKVDFMSQLPRGTVTIYAGREQVLRHPFRYVVKKGFLRTQPSTGGFDDRIRLPAGEADLRVYLAIPGETSRIERLTARLPRGATRVLQLRVDSDGNLSAQVH